AGTLAAAGPEDIEQNFSGAPLANRWYPIALANSLAGSDLQPSRADISMTINSGADYYYGFDSGGTPPQANFIDVVLHELAHGLGFLSYLNPNDGSFPSGVSDVFSNLIFDVSQNARWPAMSATQRRTSATSGISVTWDGPFSNAASSQVLGPKRGDQAFVLRTRLPNVLGTSSRSYAPAVFGRRIPAEGLSGTLVVTNDGSANPTAACAPILNVDEVRNRIAFVRRGICNFDDKVFRAQTAGAIAVVIADNAAGPLFNPGGDELVDDALVDIRIPAIFISQTDGNQLESASPGVTLTLTQVPGERVGTNASRLNLFAPSPFSSGSSISHWVAESSPDLLMEPAVNPVLDRRLDLTLPLMKDLGWQIIDMPLPHYTYTLWALENFPSGFPQTAATDDPDDDGLTNFEEYFFGSLPRSSSQSTLPTFQLDEGTRDFVFTRSRLPADMRFTVEFSTNLQNFQPAVAEIHYTQRPIQKLSPTTERVKIQWLGAEAPLFLRLRIERGS
ncbi:MAG: hypothetical protein EAZ42_10650, partial [Verrucomicrobia bacterium]